MPASFMKAHVTEVSCKINWLFMISSLKYNRLVFTTASWNDFVDKAHVTKQKLRYQKEETLNSKVLHVILFMG